MENFHRKDLLSQEDGARSSDGIVLMHATVCYLPYFEFTKGFPLHVML